MMNPEWLDFLQQNFSQSTEEPSADYPTERLYPINQLSAVSVTGTDAKTFLQGQLTCDVNEINDHCASFAAYCNAKGRVISPLLVCLKDDAMLLILPISLVEKVINSLRRYILRSNVVVENQAQQLCLLGFASQKKSIGTTPLPDEPFGVTSGRHYVVKMPGLSPRYLYFSGISDAKSFCTESMSSGQLRPGHADDWQYHDLSAGIPWFDQSASEEYIPQMLNIDKLGGISFSKGCYTGQEIVARTHYLGQAKRALYLAECDNAAQINQSTQVMDTVGNRTVGKILTFQCNDRVCRLLLVMQSEDSQQQTLALNNSAQDKIDVIPFQ